MGMKGKIIAGVVSIILVIGVVIGCVVAFVNNHHSKGKEDSLSSLSSSNKAVASICQPTDFKEQCVNSLGAVAKNESATPKELIQAAVDSTIKQVKSAIEESANIIKHAPNANSTVKMAFEDCKELLYCSMDSLQASFSTVGETEMQNLNVKEADLKNWFSAAISFQQSCIDGIPDEQLKKHMSDGMLNATQLTSNSLAIVSSLGTILGSFNITLKNGINSSISHDLLGAAMETVQHDSPKTNNNSSTSRHLSDSTLETEERGKFPAWFPAPDRKLLGRRNKNAGGVQPNAVVAQDGSGQFKTIGAALAAYPKGLKGRYVVYVKAGIYKEYVTVAKTQVNVYMYGDGPRNTIVTGSKSFADGITTQNTATFIVMGNGFIAKSMGFQNTAGPEKHQAVALRVQAEMSAFFDCRMDAYQDTLYVQAYRQFYRNCVISGTVDFIFGDSTTVIQNCLIIVRKPMIGQKNTVTAHGRQDRRETTGLVIQNCRIVPEQILFPQRFQIKSYLGRPWKMYARTVIMESELGDFIQPAGWLEWDGTFALDTLYYAEYANRGPGAATQGRVRWKGFHVITNRNDVAPFTAGTYILGGQWLKLTGIPHFLGFKN